MCRLAGVGADTSPRKVKIGKEEEVPRKSQGQSREAEVQSHRREGGQRLRR